MMPISAPIATSETMSERTMAEGMLARVARSDGLEHRRERKRHGQRDEQAHLRRHARAGKAGHQHQAAADPAEQQEDQQDGLRSDRTHEIVPSDLICTPRAISTCDSTGSVANSRSVTIRT